MRNNNKYLNSTEIARILGLTPRTAVTLLNEGRIKYSQVSSRTKRIDPLDLIFYLKKIGNDQVAMAGFKADIYKFMYSKYGSKEYWEEAGKQRKLFREYNDERARALAK